MAQESIETTDISNQHLFYYEYKVGKEEFVCVLIFNHEDLSTDTQLKANATHMRYIKKVEKDGIDVTVHYDEKESFTIGFGKGDNAESQAQRYYNFMMAQKKKQDEKRAIDTLLRAVILAALSR